MVKAVKENKKNKLYISVDITELDDAIEKVNRLKQLLVEVVELIGSLKLRP